MRGLLAGGPLVDRRVSPTSRMCQIGCRNLGHSVFKTVHFISHEWNCLNYFYSENLVVNVLRAFAEFFRVRWPVLYTQISKNICWSMSLFWGDVVCWWEFLEVDLNEVVTSHLYYKFFLSLTSTKRSQRVPFTILPEFLSEYLLQFYPSF